MTTSGSTQPFIYSDLPPYCDLFIGSKLQSRVRLLKSGNDPGNINSKQIRLYADRFSVLENSQLEASVFGIDSYLF